MDNIMIITGGTSGLGLELLKEGINRGYFVCNLARNKEKMAELNLKYTENYKGFVGDISDEAFVKSSINEISITDEPKRHHFSVFEIILAPPGEVRKFKFESAVKLPDVLEHANAFSDDFGADSVARDDGNFVVFHCDISFRCYFVHLIIFSSIRSAASGEENLLPLR